MLNNVTYIRNELSALLLIYEIIRDTLEGEPAIKGWLQSGINISSNAAAFNGAGINPFTTQAVISRAKRYLPMPNESDASQANLERYKQYLTRAVYYNVTARTHSGLVGQVFLIDPVITLPTQLEPMLKDCDGEGLTFLQSSKKAVGYNLAHGRLGLYVDFPKTDTPVTQAQIASGEIKPMIKVIAPWNIRNWQTKVVNGKTILTCVVIQENVDSYEEDSFAVNTVEQYRCLELDSVTGNYTVTVYEPKDENGKTEYQEGQTIIPTDSKGMPFKYIPFTFVGAENNDVAVDKPPMYDMASLNIAHYRNSADYEESSYICGQPTPYITGLDAEWADKYFKGGIPFGSRGGIMLPPQATVGLLEATPNSIPLVAMQEKEQQMIALGAKLVFERRKSKTATQSVQDGSSETSVLTNVADNVSAGYEFAFIAAAQFVGADTSEIEISLNTEFELTNMTPDELSKVIAMWQQGGITWPEMRDTVRKAGIANEDDEAAKKQIIQDRKDGLIPLVLAPGETPANPNPNNDPAGHANTAQKAAAGA